MMTADDTGLPGAVEPPSAYQLWREAQGVPVVSGHYVEDLGQVSVGSWARVGGQGCIINHEASEESNDCHVLELPPGGTLEAEHHLFEELIYVLDGHGATNVWSDDRTPHTFEWQAGSLFAIPLNAWHQHHNARGDRTARLLSVTNLPIVLNIFRSEEFVFGSPHGFTERYAGERDYFSGEGAREGWLLRTNLVTDARSVRLVDYRARGAGTQKVELSMAGNTMGTHVGQLPPGMYQKAHRHGPGAHLIVLSGHGYTLMWQEGEEPRRYDWRPGSMIVPPDRWFHQQFNTGPEPFRYLALRYKAVRPKGASGIPLSRISTREGGDQIEYEDEHPDIKRMYLAELERNGVALMNE